MSTANDLVVAELAHPARSEAAELTATIACLVVGAAVANVQLPATIHVVATDACAVTPTICALVVCLKQRLVARATAIGERLDIRIGTLIPVLDELADELSVLVRVSIDLLAQVEERAAES